MDNEEEHLGMIALLPASSEWCRSAMPHMTIVFLGDIKKLKKYVFNELVKRTSSVARLTKPIFTKVLGVEVFGEEEKVDVLRLESTPEIMAIREIFEEWDVSEHSFKPHATIGPTGFTNSEVPLYLVFDKITIGWGEEYITFSLVK